MDECFYFSNRSIGDGKATAWAFRPTCPACKKGLMGKPIKANGKVDKKVEHYECPHCKHRETEESIAPLIQLSVQYICPKCRHAGETTTEYKRKKFQGVSAFVFSCQTCGEKIPITKKLKEIGDSTPDDE
jgi:ssDNA-binding Zn-finger/Zn-ribbon topoisomerase 1